MAQHKEYELMPIKPIKDIQAELKRLKKEVEKASKPSKELTKVLNSNIETQKTVKSLVKTISKINDNVSNLYAVFKEVETEVEEDDPHPKLVAKLIALEEQNKQLSTELTNIQEEIKRLSYFKERLPSGLPVVYRRSETQ